MESNLTRQLVIRDALHSEFAAIGKLLVDVYSSLEGFPKPDEQPRYYELLKNVADFSAKPGCKVIAAVSDEKVMGAVVYFSDMQFYASGGKAKEEKNASGFRLLAVDPAVRGGGIGKRLTEECISRARTDERRQVIIHSTQAMQTAWKMYEAMGFERSPDLDFMQGTLPVFGFRLQLK